MRGMMCLGVLAMLVGCDASKADLDSTRTALANVTKERDDLKAQVATLEGQLTSTKADLEKEKATQAADKAGKATMATKTSAVDAPKTAAKGKRAHKS